MTVVRPDKTPMTDNALDEVDVLARTIWGEARSEGERGMVAVACLIRNRVCDRKWPNNYPDVCLQPKQFSAWNDGDPNRARMVKVTTSDAMFGKALSIAAEVMFRRLAEDPTNEANHYCTTDLFNSSRRPFWANPEKITARIGRHVFLKL